MKKSHQDCKELAPLTRFGSRIDSQLIKLAQDIDNRHEFKVIPKTTSKYLPFETNLGSEHLRPGFELDGSLGQNPSSLIYG